MTEPTPTTETGGNPCAELFRYFALFFRGETHEGWFDAWPSVGGTIEALASGEEAVPAPALAPDEVAKSFAKLFYGVSPVTIPLAESCWFNVGHLYCQTETLATREAYRAEGLTLGDAVTLPEDHLGISLEFVAVLLDAGKTEKAQAFVKEHIATWWSKACETISMREESASIAPVLKAFSTLLSDFSNWLVED